MSYWTHIKGIVEVSPLGRTQAEMRYILETVLDHLPFVTGSEGPMRVHIVQKYGYNSSSSHTEFGQYGGYFGWNKQSLSLQTQDVYFLVLEGNLRDRMFDQTYRELQKWLCRLAKRVRVYSVLINISDWQKQRIIFDNEDKYTAMFEDVSWFRDKKDKDEFKEPNWCEYLMWERAKDYDYPMKLAYKYFADKDNDAEVERRIRYERGDV